MGKPDKRRKYDAAFRTEALPVVAESRSTPAAARALNVDPKLLYQWQRDAQPALPADPAEAVEVRQLRAANWRLAQEVEILKKPSPFFPLPRRRYELLSIY
ncbi:MAG: transposase [Janthinobacterium lividum]